MITLANPIAGVPVSQVELTVVQISLGDDGLVASLVYRLIDAHGNETNRDQVNIPGEVFFAAFDAAQGSGTARCYAAFQAAMPEFAGNVI